MKVRNGFVSNSSSQSFIIALDEKVKSPEHLIKLLKTNLDYSLAEKLFNGLEGPLTIKNKIKISDALRGAWGEWSVSYNEEGYLEESSKEGKLEKALRNQINLEGREATAVEKEMLQKINSKIWDKRNKLQMDKIKKYWENNKKYFEGKKLYITEDFEDHTDQELHDGDYLNHVLHIVLNHH